jgi:uncharacterized protein (TIGR01777 family)
MRALVTGATGFLGRRLVRALDRPVILSRRPESAKRILGDLEIHAWEPIEGPPPGEALGEVEVIFHLAGEPVAAGRWNAKRKGLIRESRVRGTQNLVTAIESHQLKPKVLVSGSAVGYYGSRGEEILEESASPGTDFLSEVCIAWEAEARRAAALGTRVVTPRIGLVLGPAGGALARMLTPFKLGLGGKLASGEQWMPWIHIDDIVGLFLHAAERSEILGPMNAVAPSPVRNSEFTRTLARVLGRPAVFPVPALALKIIFGELASALLASERVVPHVAEETGYRYRYSSLEEALRASVTGPGR